VTQAELCLNPSVSRADEARLGKQQRRLLDALLRGPVTNIQAVMDLRILNATARISELRQVGYRVDAQRGSEGVWTYRLVRP
jgi:hypothetical protein